MTTTHHHEDWQIRDDGSGRYCAACGATMPDAVRIPVTNTNPPRLRLTVIKGEEVVAMTTFPAPSAEWVEAGKHPRVWESMLASQWFRTFPTWSFDAEAGDRIESEYLR